MRRKRELKKKFRLFTEFIGDAVIPKKYRKDILNYHQRASVKEVPYYYFGLSVYLFFIIAVLLDILVLNSEIFSNINIFIGILLSVLFLPVIFVLVCLFNIFIYRLFLDARIYHKVRKMEEVFPEFLDELSLNLKSGLSLENAMENSLEKEFTYLNDEIERVCKKISVGNDLEESVKEFTGRFDSEIIEETFDLILISWKKGANTPPLVDRMADNIEETRYLQKKVIASVTSYKIFLSIVSLIITPAMFALAFHLVNLIRSMLNKISAVSRTSTVPFNIVRVRVDDSDFMLFSYLAIAIIAAFTSIIISVIMKGSIKDNYKEIFLYILGSLASYRVAMFGFSIFFSWFTI
ncbi:hypothetical protein GF327_03185 [Candidatus Woesearchaeota archaeon]|nr:hypothetical protein [Candidatus Woesearchaeota archaeon]